MPKLPLPDPATLGSTEADVVALAPHSSLWRVHRASGRHPRPWAEFRRYGPVDTCRFDPHAPPPRVQSEGVLYTALDVTTALAEAFQTERVVDRVTDRPHLVAIRLTRTLQLLDLTGLWPVRAGGSHVINTGRHEVCRAWARAIRARWPDLDGLWHTSSMSGLPMATLWNPARDAVGDVPAFNVPLGHAGLDPWIRDAAQSIGYLVR